MNTIVRTVRCNRLLALRVGTDVAAIAPAVRQAIRDLGADAPFNVPAMAEIRSSSVAERRFVLMLVGLFGFLALALAAVGVYRIITLVAAERTPESAFGSRSVRPRRMSCRWCWATR